MRSMRLTIRENDWQKLRAHLFRDDNLERQAFLELGLYISTTERADLFVYRILPVSDDSYARQSMVQVIPQTQVTVNAYNSFFHAEVAVHGHVHSHPFTDNARFSETDKQCLTSMISGLRGVKRTLGAEGNVFCFLMVMGRSENGCYGELADLEGNIFAVLSELNIIGMTGKKILSTSNGNPTSGQEKRFGMFPRISLFSQRDKEAQSGTPENPEIHVLDRNVRLLGNNGQEILENTHLAICGCGGVGAMLIANLRGLGIRKYTLVDPEKLEKSNLNRFPGAGREDVGEYKVNILRREVLRVFPETEVTALTGGVGDRDVQKYITETDLLIAAVDGMAPRAELQGIAARLMKPLFDIGSGVRLDPQGNVKRMGSQVIVYLPGGPCLKCQGMDIFKPETGIAGEIRRASGYIEGTDMTPTSVAFINSVIAGYTVDMIVSYLTGLRNVPLYLEFDQWTWSMSVRKFVRRPHCPVCGDNGIEGKGIE